MTQIKMQRDINGPWSSVEWIYDESRPGWVKVKDGDNEAEWVNEDHIHPADKVVLQVERLAMARYEWVPKEDLARDDSDE